MSLKSMFVVGAFVSVLAWAMAPALGQQLALPVAPDPASESLQPTAFVVPVQAVETLDRIETAAIDLAAVQAEDQLRDAQGEPPRFAIPNQVLITPASQGTWEYIDGDTMLWRLRITCPGAMSINLGFTRYYMPAGAHLFLYSADGSEKTRAFTDIDNFDHRQLWTPVVLSDDIIVELTIPQALIGQLELELTSINHGYRFFRKAAQDDGSPRAGSCNTDVICAAANAWRTEIPAIAVYHTGGQLICSGSMINNTSLNQVPYFLTANHCEVTSGNAPSMVVYWNYYSPTCGAHGGGSLSTYQSGATFKAAYSTSDFTLVQLNSSPNPSWGITYAGWDRNGLNPATGACIHHPSCDEKSITFFNSTTHASHGSSWGCSAYPGPGDNTHIKVYWDPAVGAVTEPGSSGSPLFDNNHRIIGQLHGGDSACGATGDSLSDCFGRISRSWTGGSSSSTRLSDWLDPTGTGATYVDTLNPAAGLAVTPADGLSSSGGAGGPFSPSSKVYTLTNQGASSINYTVAKTQSWVTLSSTGGTLAGGANTTITVSINSNANSLGVGNYNDTVTFTNTTNHSGDTTRSVSLQVLASFGVTPADGLTSSGMVGGPFSPSSKDYTLTNSSGSSINYTVGKTQSWVTLSSTGGTLTAGSNTTITVSINSGANSLTAGSYGDTVTFTNTSTHEGDTTRPVSLMVNPLSNDLCANATVVCTGTYTGTTVGMTRDGSVNCDGTAGPDVWFKYTPSTSGSTTFSLCSSATVWDSVLSVHSGSPGTESNQLNCNDDGCSGSGGRHGTITRSVTAGTTYWIRVGGYETTDSGPFTLTISGQGCDSTAPTPNPMTFASAPAAASSTSIAMTANTATDATPPVSYYFDFVSGGAGGDDSAWQTGTSYTDSGLSPNASYTYRVKARDSAPTPNETSYSSNYSAVTLANVPTAPTLSGATRTTLNLDVNVNGNPAATEFAVQCTASSPADSAWTGKYVSAGGAASASAVWRTDAQWGTTTVTGLQPCTTYTFAVKARNSEAVETAFSGGASLGAAGRQGDLNGDGVVHGDDIQSFVTCKISGGTGCACATMSVSAFVNCLLDAGACP